MNSRRLSFVRVYVNVDFEMLGHYAEIQLVHWTWAAIYYKVKVIGVDYSLKNIR